MSKRSRRRAKTAAVKPSPKPAKAAKPHEALVPEIQRADVVEQVRVRQTRCPGCGEPWRGFGECVACDPDRWLARPPLTVAVVRRPAIAVLQERDNPSDQRAVGKSLGYQRPDWVRNLHLRSPDEITRHHVRACDRLRDDVEMAAGASAGSDGSGVRGAPNPEARMLAQADAIASVARVKAALGVSGWAMVEAVVISGNSLATWAAAKAASNHAAKGELKAHLTRLLEHYEPVRPPLARRSQDCA